MLSTDTLSCTPFLLILPRPRPLSSSCAHAFICQPFFCLFLFLLELRWLPPLLAAVTETEWECRGAAGHAYSSVSAGMAFCNICLHHTPRLFLRHVNCFPIIFPAPTLLKFPDYNYFWKSAGLLDRCRSIERTL